MACAGDVVVAADGGQPGKAVAWSLDDGSAVVTGASRVYGLTSVAANDRHVAFGGYDKRVWVIDREGKRTHVFETRAAPHALAFSPDGAFLLVGDDRTPRLLPLQKKLEERALKGHLSAVKAAAFSADGRYAATAGGDRKIKLHDVATGKVLATMQGYASTLAFVESGLLYVGFDCAAIVAVPTGKPVKALDLGFLDRAAVSGDGRRLAIKSGSDDALVRVLELATGREVFSRTFEPVRSLALDHDGERLVVARAAMLAQGTSLEVWSTANGERLLPRGAGHTGGVTAIAVPKLAVSASADRTIKLWDVVSGTEIETIAPEERASDGIGAMAVSPDGTQAITSLGYGRRSSLERWDLARLCKVGPLDTEDLGSARALAISPDGKTAAASFVRKAALYELASGKRTRVLEKHKGQIDAIVFSRDGAYVVTGAADNLVKVWRASDGAELHALAGHRSFVHSLACLPDGSCVSGSVELLRWDLATGRRLAEGAVSGEASAMAASPDGRWLLAASSFDERVFLYDAAKLRKVHELAIDESAASVAFADDQTALVGTRGGRIVKLSLVR